MLAPQCLHFPSNNEIAPGHYLQLCHSVRGLCVTLRTCELLGGCDWCGGCDEG